MDAQLEKRWVVALRSGDHEQCRSGGMSEGGKHCALMVLAIVAGLDITDPSSCGFYDQVHELVGGRKVAWEFIDMNDHSAGKSFDEIADAIESGKVLL